MRADLLVRNVGRLVTCADGLGEGPLGVIENGALAAREGRIVWVGRESDIDVEGDHREVDARGMAVLPGLIDCHTHLVFAGDRANEYAARVRGEPYTTGGVRVTVEATRNATDDELRSLARERLDRFLLHGVTTIEAKSGYGLSTEHERRLLRIAATTDHTVDVIRTFLGAHVPSPEYPVEQVVADLADIGSLAEFADVWCDEGAFSVEQTRTILRAARAAGLGVKVHAEQMARSGGAAVAAEFGAVSADHLEHATEDDADALARARTVAVLLPGASMMTRAPFAPARMLIERGVRVALSTDFNPGTSYSENLQLVVALACAHLRMTPEEAILGVTRHAAAALSREGRIGSLQPGAAAADLLVLGSRNEVDLAYHYGVNLVEQVLKGQAG